MNSYIEALEKQNEQLRELLEAAQKRLDEKETIIKSLRNKLGVVLNDSFDY